MRHALALIALGLIALGGLVLAGGARSAPTDENPPRPEPSPPVEVPQLSMTWSDSSHFVANISAENTPPTVGFSLVVFGRSRWPAHVTIAAPKGFSLDTTFPRGTSMGYGVLALTHSGKDIPLASASAEIVVGDARSYRSASRTCAPGGHTAVWQLTLSGLRSAWDKIEIPLFIDREGAGWRLQLCIPPMLAKLPGKILILAASFTGPSAPPSARGSYTWSARVMPFSGDRTRQEPKRAYELRSTVLVPHLLTMTGRYDSTTASAELSGIVSGAGRGREGVRVFVGGFGDAELRDFRMLGSTRTDASGAWSFRTPLAKSTTFVSAVDGRVQRCGSRSTAPAGCFGQTTSPPPSVATTLTPEG